MPACSCILRSAQPKHYLTPPNMRCVRGLNKGVYLRRRQGPHRFGAGSGGVVSKCQPTLTAVRRGVKIAA
jgi:hypothetical protein